MSAEIFSFPEQKQKQQRHHAPVTMHTSRVIDAAKYYILVTGEYQKAQQILQFMLTDGVAFDCLVPPAIADLVDAVNLKVLYIVEMGGTPPDE